MKKLTLSLSVSICILSAILVQAQVPPEQARNYQINETHTGSISVPGLTPPLKQKWSVNFGWPISYPLIADGKVFVTVKNVPVTSGTTLVALNAGDGSMLWSVNLGGSSFWSTLCYENGRVFALISNGLLRAFDGTSGALIWARQLPGQFSFTSPPTVFQGVVYAGGGGNGGTAYAVSADTGNVLWSVPLANAGSSSPAVTTEGVYLSYLCINVYKLNPANGSQIWRNYIPCGSGSGRVPVLYNNRLYARSPGSNSDWIYDSQTGGLAGDFNTSKSAPAFSGNMGFFLYWPGFSGSYGTLVGRNVDSNLVYWSFTGDGALQSSLLVVNDYVYVGSNTGKLFAVEAATGHQVWSTTAGTSIPSVDEVSSSQPITGFAAGEGILVVPTSTTLVAYESDNSPTITWGSPIPAPNAFGWNNTPVQIPFTAVAHPSGLVFSTPESPLQFNSEGINQTQQVSVIDQLGLSATLTSPAVKIDLTAPVTTSAVSGTYGPGVTVWYQNSAQVTLTRTDNLSGIYRSYYTIDGGATQQYAPITIQTDGSHTLNFWSSDIALNNETPQSIVVNVDVNAPSTQISTGSGFYASPTQVALTATDSGSGVSNTFYQIDSGATQTYSAPFMVSGDSNRTIRYWSVDWAGHTENQHLYTLKLDGSAPSTTIATTGTNGWNGWRTSPVQVTLSPSDARSGVAATYYTVDGGPSQTYSGPFMINESAAHQVNFWSVDNVGNAEAPKSAEVKIDKDAPVTESSLSGPAGTNNYFKGSVQVTLTATDSVAGLASLGTHYKIDNGPMMAYMSAPFTVSGDGSHTVSFWSTDLAGNEASPNAITIKIDATAPLTQAALSGTPGVNGWYSTAVQVTLSATDSTSGPGSTYYAVDGGLQQTYEGPFTLSTTGSHTVLYWSRDLADNVEAQHSIIIKVDLSSPTTTASVNGNSGNGWYQAPAQVTLTASDSESGVGSTFYTVDGGATQTYAGPFNVSASGVHSINYWSVDAVGNSEHQQSLTVQIDVTAPTTVISTSGTAGNNGWYISAATVSLTASDNNQAGVANTYYSVEGGAAQTYTAPFTISNSGYYTIIYWSVDVAGNTESQHSMLLKVDVDAPTTTAQVSSTSWWDVWYLSPAEVYLNGSDGGASGVANIYYTIDGGAIQTTTGTINITAGGVHTVNYWSVDKAGNTEAQKSVTVRVDSAAPTTQITTGGTGANGWYRGPVQVALPASDPESGVAFTMYRVDGGQTQIYSAPFTISGEGQHEVLYYSNDKLGHNEAQQSATIRIDSTLPTAQSSVSGTAGGNGYFKSAVQFTITASDNLSGVANRYYRINGGAAQTYGSPFTISSDGNYSIDYWSVDVAGNVSGVGTVPIKIDTTAPLSQASGSGTAGTNGWYRSSVLVSLSAADSLSGVQTTFYKLDGGTTKTYTAAFSVSGNGSHTVNFWSVDKATNTETTRSQAINIDSNTPGVTASVSPSSVNKSSNPVTITVSGHATDTVSGVPLTGGATFSVLDEYGVAQPSGPITLQANGNYSFTLTLPATKNAGDSYHLYTITVVGTDRAGNTSTDSDTLRIN